LLNEHDFAADNVEKLSHALVEDEREEFGYKARMLDWWDIGSTFISGIASVDLSVDRG